MKLSPKSVKAIKTMLYGGMGVGGVSLAGSSVMKMHAAGRDAVDMLNTSDTSPYWLLRLKGAIPLNSSVNTDEESALEAVRGAIPGYDRLSGRTKKLVDSVLRAQIRPAIDGRNAMYVANDNGKPVFIGPAKGMNTSIAKHETGHYRAMKKLYGSPEKYREALLRARSKSGMLHLGNMFRKNLYGRPGDLTLPGLEREAWEMAPSGYDPKMRDIALKTYETAHTEGPKLMLGTAVGGIGIGKLLGVLLKSRRGI